MFSYNTTNNYPSTYNPTNPCSSTLLYGNDNNNWMNKNFNNSRPSNCYRPLQQLYKTVYSPMNGNNSVTMNIACICRPAERYKTTNMTYGSFYYDDWISTQKNRAINYDRAVFAQCYTNNNNKMGYQSTGNNRGKDASTFSNLIDPQESQYWTQPTSDTCCPTNCCNNTTYNTANCTNYQNNDPCYSSFAQQTVPSYSSQIPSTINNTFNNQSHFV